MLPLGLLTTGEKGEIVEIKETHVEPHTTPKKKMTKHRRLEEMGFRTGKKIEILNNEGHGALLVRVGGSRIALSRRMALKIMVKKEKHA